MTYTFFERTGGSVTHRRVGVQYDIIASEILSGADFAFLLPIGMAL
jgi:hypothetical protein